MKEAIINTLREHILIFRGFTKELERICDNADRYDTARLEKLETVVGVAHEVLYGALRKFAEK